MNKVAFNGMSARGPHASLRWTIAGTELEARKLQAVLSAVFDDYEIEDICVRCVHVWHGKNDAVVVELVTDAEIYELAAWEEETLRAAAIRLTDALPKLLESATEFLTSTKVALEELNDEAGGRRVRA